MKLNKKIITPACVALSMFALGIGATYALFSSNAKNDINITAGKVNVSSTISGLKTYSGINLVGDPNVDINYTDDLGGAFSNGGSATIDGNTLILDKVSPGDKAVFDLKTENKSNVSIKWRYSYQVIEDNGLASGLKINVDSNNAEITKIKHNSNWMNQSQESSKTHTITIELPSDKGNEYQEKTCRIRFLVEAVQSNAYVENINYEIFDKTDLLTIRNSVNNGRNYSGETIGLVNDIDLTGESWVPIGNSEANAFAGSFNGCGHTIENLTITNPNSEGTGFFGYVSNPTEKTVFKNVALKDAQVTLDAASQGKNVGAFIGYALKASKDITIDNIDVTGNSHVTGKSHVAGIVGKIYSKNAMVKNCDNYATVVCGSLYGAGVVGIASNVEQTIVFDSNTNNSPVSGSTVGGIVGRIGSLDVDIIDCHNYSNLNGSTVVGGIVGAGDGTISLDIDQKSSNADAAILTGATKGLLVGYIYKYTSSKCEISIHGNGTQEYADTANTSLIGLFSICTLTLDNIKVHSLTLDSSWKYVCYINLDNCVVDAINWNTSSGMYPSSHSDDGEYLYIDGNNNSTVTVLNYNQSQPHYTNYYSFKDISIPINNPSGAPLEQVSWFE